MSLPLPSVAIVGAGPAGASLALLLVERGIAVTLLEASRSFERQFRGEGLMPSGLEALDQIGLTPLLSQLPSRPLTGWSFQLDGRELFRVDEPLGDDHRPCTLVSQPELLAALVSRARRCPGFTWRPGETVRGPIVVNGRVGGVQLGDGRVVYASLVVGSDGRSSPLRQRAGLILEKSGSPIDLLWFRLPAHPRFETDNVFTMLLGEGGACSVFHGARAGELHLGWVVAAGERIERSGAEWSEAFAALAPGWLADHIRANAAAISAPLPLSVQVGCSPRWYRPGLLLLGDAAHPMSPIRAQGINMALRDAIVAANQLVPALRSGSEAAIDAALARVQAERAPEIHAAQTLQQAEAGQGLLLRQWPLLRRSLSVLAPLVRERVRSSWLDRQLPLRRGLSPVRLVV